MLDRSSTEGQTNGTMVMPGDEMNAAPRQRRRPALGDEMNGQGEGAQEETTTGFSTMPIPQPHNIALRHHAGALTVDWHTAPNGYEVALVRGRHEILNQPCINPPTTLSTDAVPAGEYCVVVKARTNGGADDDQGDRQSCIVKLATPAQIALTYNEALQRLEVQWQPVTGAQGYRVQVVQVVVEADVPAASNRWTLSSAAAGKAARRQLQAWVQAQGDERYYVDSNIGKSAIFEFTVAGPAWGLFDRSDFDQADFFPEGEETAAAASDFTVAGMDEEEAETWPLTLLIAEKAGMGYTLDDNVGSPSSGEVAEDGLLVHPVSSLAEGAVITFDDGSEVIELLFAPAEEEDALTPETFLAETYQLDLDWVEEEEEAEAEDLAFVAPVPDDEDENTLSLFIPGKENSAYTLDDHVNAPTTGQVTADGLLIHAVALTAESCMIQFQDGSGDSVEFIFAPD